MEIDLSQPKFLPSTFHFALFTLHFFLLGCATNQQTFNVIARNETAGYVTLNLAKNVPQGDPRWASPEDIDDSRVIVTPFTAEEQLGIKAAAPGQTVHFLNYRGTFPHGVLAVLRVYRGKDIPQRIALEMKPGADRQDMLLLPGDNRFIIRDKDGKMVVDRVK